MDLQLNHTTNEEKNWDEKNQQQPDQNITCTKTNETSYEKQTSFVGFYEGHIVWFISAINPDALWVPCDLWAVTSCQSKFKEGVIALKVTNYQKVLFQCCFTSFTWRKRSSERSDVFFLLLLLLFFNTVSYLEKRCHDGNAFYAERTKQQTDNLKVF